MPGKTTPKRCKWVNEDPLYIAYHDEEWGVPVFDDRTLFELLLLEGAQAGLSWYTILKKRENYRHAFDGFDPVRIARYDARKKNALMKDAGIVRNRLKIEAAIINARAYLEVLERGETLGALLWDHVNGIPTQNRWRRQQDVPASTPQSEAMSRGLRRLGFKFVGSTICYAFMQAAGLVNDHLVSCFRHSKIKSRYGAREQK